MSLLDRTERRAVSFAAGLAAHGDRLAVATPDGALSYGDLAARVEHTARRLGDQRRLVLLAGANELDALVAYLAALAGGHPVILVPGGPAGLAPLVEQLDPDVVLSAGTGWSVDERREGSAHELHPDLAVLLGTSGSTGSPRLVRLSHQNIESNAAAIAGYLRLGGDDRGITSLPMHYCYGLSIINSHLATGAGIVLTDRSVVDPCFWDLFRAQGATSLAGVPHTFELLDRVGFDAMALPTLRRVTQAGGRLHPDRVRRYAELGRRNGWDLFVMYGQTEATARMAYLPPALAAEHPAAIGIPIPGGAFELAPVDEVDEPGVGELVYRGQNVMLGYAETAGDLALGSTVDALRTGDLARRTPEGLYEVVGRRSRFAKIFGLRLDLQHLEDRLLDAGITATCTSDDDRIIAAVSRAEDDTPALHALRDICDLPASRLAVVVLPHLPRLPNGKVDHRAIRRLAPAPDAPTTIPPSAAADGVHPDVGRHVAEVLQRPDLTADDTFVGLGGDSFSYVEMSIKLEEVLGTLPADWHVRPLRDLRPARRSSPRLRRTETTVVLRAIAIVLVVGTHIKLFEVLGGAHLLLAIAGYNFTRFGGRPRDAVRSIARIAVPSMLWLAGAALLYPRIHATHALLVRGWFGPEGSHGGYWYIEAIVQILVPLAVLLSIPAVRRVERAHRFGFALGVLAAGLLVRFHVVDLPTAEPHDIRAHDIVWIFAIGWAAAQARSRLDRAVLSAVIVAGVPGYFGEPGREVLVVAGLLLLVWVPTLPLVRPAVRAVGAVAAASLYIYLTHWQVFPPIEDRFGRVAALGGAVLAGILAWTISRWVTRGIGWLAARWRERRRQEAVAPAGSSGTVSPAAGPAAISSVA